MAHPCDLPCTIIKLQNYVICLQLRVKTSELHSLECSGEKKHCPKTLSENTVRKHCPKILFEIPSYFNVFDVDSLQFFQPSDASICM